MPKLEDRKQVTIQVLNTEIRIMYKYEDCINRILDALLKEGLINPEILLRTQIEDIKLVVD